MGGAALLLAIVVGLSHGQRPLWYPSRLEGWKGLDPIDPVCSGRTRIILSSVSLLLLLFFGLTILALDSVFRDLSERAIRDRLDVQVLALISATEETAAHDLVPSGQITESSRFANPGSGLYGEVRRRNGAPAWRSDSMAGTRLLFPDDIAPGRHDPALASVDEPE